LLLAESNKDEEELGKLAIVLVMLLVALLLRMQGLRLFFCGMASEQRVS
jgi:hypothetical protein